MSTAARDKTARVASSGELVGAACVVHGVHFVSTGTGGTLVLKDGGADGTVKVTIDTPAVAEGDYLQFQGGLQFDTDCYAVLTDVGGCTIVYQDN